MPVEILLVNSLNLRYIDVLQGARSSVPGSGSKTDVLKRSGGCEHAEGETINVPNKPSDCKEYQHMPPKCTRTVHLHCRVCARFSSLCVKGRELEGGGAIAGRCRKRYCSWRKRSYYCSLSSKNCLGRCVLEVSWARKQADFGVRKMAGRPLEISQRHNASDLQLSDKNSSVIHLHRINYCIFCKQSQTIFKILICLIMKREL
jgi:hypothetical protein